MSLSIRNLNDQNLVKISDYNIDMFILDGPFFEARFHHRKPEYDALIKGFEGEGDMYMYISIVFQVLHTPCFPII